MANGLNFEIGDLQVMLIEIHRMDHYRLHREIVQDIAAAAGNGHDAAVGIHLQGFHIHAGIFPNLGVDDAVKPIAEHPVQQAFFRCDRVFLNRIAYHCRGIRRHGLTITPIV